MMKHKDIVLEKLLALAKTKGLSDVEAYQVKSYSRSVFFEANRLKQIESSQSEGIALRLWRQGCPGLAVAYGEVAPEDLLEKAIALSHLNPSETIELASKNTLIYSATVKKPPVEKLIATGREAIATIRDAYPEVISSAELEWEEETTTLINSQGLYCQNTDTSLSYSLGVEWVRGEDFLAIYDGEYTKAELTSEKVVREIIQRLDWAKFNVSPPTGKVPILFTPNAATILWSTAVDALNGKRVAEGSSPWSESSGKLVMADNLTLSQKPALKPHDCPFDDEGTPTQNLILINRGRVEKFYSDRTTARKLGSQTTGNGFRPSLARYPTPDLVNLIIEGGKESFLDLISQLDRAIIVEQILGGGADISGDFSVNVDLGYRVEKGEIVGRVKDTMVAGNVYHALKQVRALGNDFSWSGSCYTPSIVVEGLSVVGDNSI